MISRCLMGGMAVVRELRAAVENGHIPDEDGAPLTAAPTASSPDGPAPTVTW